MKQHTLKLLFVLALSLSPLLGKAQFLGAAWQTGSGNKDQFAASVSAPYWKMCRTMNDKMPFRDGVGYIIGGGVDYTTSGSKISGLNIKPIQLALIPRITDNCPFTVALKADAGYNINLTHGNSGILVSPALYVDYKILYATVGYDYNTFHNEGQFNIRLGIGIPWGLIKSIH